MAIKHGHMFNVFDISDITILWIEIKKQKLI